MKKRLLKKRYFKGGSDMALWLEAKFL